MFPLPNFFFKWLDQWLALFWSLYFRRYLKRVNCFLLASLETSPQRPLRQLVNLVDNATEQQRAQELLVNCCEWERCTFSTDEKRGSSWQHKVQLQKAIWGVLTVFFQQAEKNLSCELHEAPRSLGENDKHSSNRSALYLMQVFA